MTAKVPSLNFDASSLPKEQQFAAWARFVTSYEVETPTPDNGFVCVSSAWMLGPMMINITGLGPVIMRREAPRIRADGIDHYVMIMLLEGSWTGDLDGRVVNMGTEDICLLDLSRPLNTISARGSTSITLLVPRLTLDERVPPFDMHGLVLDAASGLLFSDYLKALIQRLPDIDAADALAVSQATLDHLTSTLTTVRQRLAPKANSAVLARAKRHIAVNLGAELGTEEIATAIGTSRSTLFRAFAPLGGLPAYVQERRLARAYALLSEPEQVRTVAEIAYEAGFKSHAHFSRLFGRAYGHSPKQLLSGTPGEPLLQPAGSDVHEAYHRWGGRLRR